MDSEPIADWNPCLANDILTKVKTLVRDVRKIFEYSGMQSTTLTLSLMLEGYSIVRSTEHHCKRLFKDLHSSLSNINSFIFALYLYYLQELLK